MRQTIQSDKHWHEMRRANVGASEVPALFGCGFQTHFELWHEKKGDLGHADYSDNERVVLGRCLEAGIAAAASELYGLELKKSDSYFTDDTTPGLGATPDYFLIREGTEFPCEVKNASYGQFRDNWPMDEQGVIEPPLRYLIQVQTQLACCNANFAKLIALISGDRIVMCDIPRHEPTIAEIRYRVPAFWKSIADNEEPPAQMPADLDAAKKVWTAGDSSVDLCGDPDVEQWLAQISELRQLRHKIEADTDAIEGEVLSYCVRNSFAAVRANGGRISCKQREAKPARMVEFKAQPAKVELRITPAKS